MTRIALQFHSAYNKMNIYYFVIVELPFTDLLKLYIY